MSLVARLRPWARRPAVFIGAPVLVAIVLWFRVGSRADAGAAIETAEVTVGDFLDTLSLRGEVKALRSAVVTAPSGAGDVQIITMARSNTPVKQNDIVVEFDKTIVQRTLAEKRTALRQAEAEIAKARAQARLDQEATRTEQVKGQYDVERAKLEVGTREVVSTYDAAKAELSLSDAQQRVKEVDARIGASAASQRAEMQGLIAKRDKAAADVALAETQLARLTVRAPVDGPFLVQMMWRGTGESEFRAGDRVWSGAVIAEIPDPSKVYLAARVDEADRGRLKTGMTATTTSDALPGVDIPAKIVAFSRLARPDYSTWPPPRMFDVVIEFDQPDARVRPGLTASIRVAVDRLERTLLLPSRAVMQVDGRSIVYVAGPRGFEARRVVVARKNLAQVALSEGVKAGERVALRDPTRPDAAPAGASAAPMTPGSPTR